jgi:hypothetical protein
MRRATAHPHACNRYLSRPNPRLVAKIAFAVIPVEESAISKALRLLPLLALGILEVAKVLLTQLHLLLYTGYL